MVDPWFGPDEVAPLCSMLHSAVGFSFPRVDEGRGVDCCPIPEVIRLSGRSYQDWMLRKPVRLGGMGLRSVAETSLAAYIGGVEQAVSHFVGEGGICQKLGPVLGDMQHPASKWEGMMTSGCRTGEEFAASWNTLRQEATESCQYLDKEI